jgi:hypothetical protein
MSINRWGFAAGSIINQADKQVTYFFSVFKAFVSGITPRKSGTPELSNIFEGCHGMAYMAANFPL